MKWHNTDPINDGEYLCAVKNSNTPIILRWRNDREEWGVFVDDESEVSYEYWQSFGNNAVLYYMNLDDIPMPEGW